VTRNDRFHWNEEWFDPKDSKLCIVVDLKNGLRNSSCLSGQLGGWPSVDCLECASGSGLQF
jgi:hypothetical protein